MVRRRNAASVDLPEVLPGVSILKPLKGADPGLAENLRSFFRLDYPDFEILFCLESPRDSAYSIVQAIASDYPRVAYRVFFSGGGSDSAFRNPKVANIENASIFAQYDLQLIADSNVRIDSETFRSFVAEIHRPGVGIVSAIVEGVVDAEGAGRSNSAGRLEAMALNTFYARGMALAEFAGQACVMGKAMLFRGSTLARLGGVSALGRYLAEDYMAGFGIRQLGYEICVARLPIRQVIGDYTMSQFWNRHVRWARIRKAQAPFAFFAEPVMQPFFLALLGAAITGHGGTAFGLLGVFYAADALVRRRSPGLMDAWVWMKREALAPVLWAAAAFGSEVEWRGKRMRVEFGGILETIQGESR